MRLETIHTMSEKSPSTESFVAFQILVVEEWCLCNLSVEKRRYHPFRVALPSTAVGEDHIYKEFGLYCLNSNFQGLYMVQQGEVCEKVRDEKGIETCKVATSKLPFLKSYRMSIINDFQVSRIIDLSSSSDVFVGSAFSSRPHLLSRPQRPPRPPRSRLRVSKRRPVCLRRKRIKFLSYFTQVTWNPFALHGQEHLTPSLP